MNIEILNSGDIMSGGCQYEFWEKWVFAKNDLIRMDLTKSLEFKKYEDQMLLHSYLYDLFCYLTEKKLIR